MGRASSRLFAGERRESRLLGLYAVFVSLFLIFPIAMAVVLSFNARPRIQFPPEGFSWRWYLAAHRNDDFHDGFWTSAIVAALTTTISALAGTAAALAINHFRFRGRAIFQALLGLPLALPAVVIGLGLLFVFPLYGLKPGIVACTLSHAVIGTAYVAYLVLATLANYDMNLERASADLGASRGQTFLHVTLPIIRPGIVAGAVFAFLLSFDNVSLSLFATKGETLPLKLLQHIQFQSDPTVAAVSSVLLALSFVFLVLFFRVLSERQLTELSRRAATPTGA